MINYRRGGIIFDIQRYSIHDGPGIRTIAFLQGCPLSCKWCCNPESQSLKPVLLFNADVCIHCGRCLNACKRGALSTKNPSLIDRNVCAACGECVKVCPAGALVIKGKEMTVEQLVKELKKDSITFRRSNGGITLSGGEPLMQSDFAAELLKACKEQGWHTAMETTGLASEESLNKVFPWVDLVLLDIKAFDPAIHKKYTGVSNEVILKNSIIISNITSAVVRIPTVRGVNATVSEYEAICGHVKKMNGVDTIHILPYHTYGENKYSLLGEKYPLKDLTSLSKEEIESLKKVVESAGFKCVIGG
ncbi:MAG: glycyl-radical enzyme activating protein [Synergistaceae bacterium]|jgi:pyruvate formate lyase activating enzyme|nr:glycyl-radical enzyme activating protein [Synergistaceae bacterium]